MNTVSPRRSLLRHAQHMRRGVGVPTRGAASRAISSTEFMGGRHKAGHDDDILSAHLM
jgi:hypothetical protein